MKKNFAIYPALVMAAAALAFAQAQSPAAANASVPAAGPIPTKVATIHIANAIMSTKDGQAAAKALNAKFGPRKQELDRKNQAIAALRDQLSKGSATMSQAAKDQLARQIEDQTKQLNRETEDAQSDLDQENSRVMQDLGNKMLAVIEQFATKNGYAMVLDVSSPQTPVLWASAAVDITNQIVQLYDQAHPQAEAAPTASKPATQK